MRSIQLLLSLVLLLRKSLLMADPGLTDSSKHGLLLEQTIVRAGRFDHGSVTRQAGCRCSGPGENGACQRFEKCL